MAYKAALPLAVEWHTYMCQFAQTTGPAFGTFNGIRWNLSALLFSHLSYFVTAEFHGWNIMIGKAISLSLSLPIEDRNKKSAEI